MQILNVKPNLLFTLIFYNYDKFYEIYINQKPDSYSEYEKARTKYCFKYTICRINGGKKRLILVHEKKKSWNEASQLCQDIGGYLPYFTSREHLNEMIAFLKLLHDIAPLPYIFIGLKYDAKKGISFIFTIL